MPLQMIDKRQNDKCYYFRKYFRKYGKTELNLKFSSQHKAKSINLYYNWHRYYSPKIGRYFKIDPFLNLFSFNNYFYVKSNPIIKYDFNGLFVIDRSCECKPYDVKKASEEACTKYIPILASIRPDLKNCIDSACRSGKIYCNNCKKKERQAESPTIVGKFLCPGQNCYIRICKRFKDLKPRYQACTIIHEIAHLCGVGKKGGNYEEREKEVMELEQKTCWGEEITVTP